MRGRFGAAGAWGQCAPAAPVRRGRAASTSPLGGGSPGILLTHGALYSRGEWCDNPAIRAGEV